MNINIFKRLLFIIAFSFPFIGFAQSIGVFYDTSNEQIKFAANDVKAALEAKSFTVEMLPLSSLSSTYANKKVVISLITDNNAINILKSEGGTIPTGIGEQAYGLRTTTTNNTSYWVIGGDVNGVMYGGIQISENIKFNGFSQVYNNQESPTILKRGIKLNLPWDKNSGTYGKANLGTFDGKSAQLAIKDVWDISFWTMWFDEMARNRYNSISLWSCNPFSSLVSVPGYEDCSIQNVTYYDGTVKTMSINDKIVFWKQVMAYAHARGFEFLLFNWNVFTDGIAGKHGISDSPTNVNTKDYMYKAMKNLLETYPDFDGFGMSLGENGGTEDFVWNTYGKAMYDYALANPKRKLQFIHRLHYGDFSSMLSLFAPLRSLSNVTFTTSVKYSQAHLYSAPTPNWWPSEFNTIKSNNLKTWLTVRNDDMYYLTWGDPDFARVYVKGMVALGDIYNGFYMGCDGFNPTRTFFSKNSITQGTLEVQRQQYMMKLWGRLSYNPNTSDDVFKNYMAVKYPTVSSDNLFNAWRQSSRGIQLATELIQGTYKLDFDWWPETCSYKGGFRTISDFGGAIITPGSTLCSISSSASGGCNGKKTSYQVAESIKIASYDALSLISGMSAGSNTELGVTLNNIKALSYIGLYYAEKILGATYKKAGNTTSARDAMGRAYCNWMSYANIIDAMFTGMKNQRVDELVNWHSVDAKVLAEYTSLGGTGIPQCNSVNVTGLTVSPTSLTINGIGASAQLTKTVLPTNAANQNVTWNSSNNLIASVDANGKVTGVAIGSAVITVKTVEGNFTATSNINVVPVIEYTLTTAATNGTITSNPSGPKYAVGTVVNLTATANVGYKFSSWGGNHSGAINPDTIIMNANKSVTANFVVDNESPTPVTPLTGWVSGTTNNKVAGSNRFIVVMVMGESASNFGANGVTYGGQSMTKQIDKMYFVSGNRTYASIFTLNEAGVNAATSGTIAVTWSATPSVSNSIYSVLLSNVDQITPAITPVNNGLTGTSIEIATTLTAATGDMAIMCGATENNVIQTFNNGFIKEFETNSTWGDGVGGYKLGTGTNETPKFTQSTSGRMALCALIVKKASLNLRSLAANTIESVDIKENGTHIYPNPVSNILNIDFADAETSREIKVFTITGQLLRCVQTQNASVQIDVKSLKINGVVLIQVIEGNTVSNYRVIVK